MISRVDVEKELADEVRYFEQPDPNNPVYREGDIYRLKRLVRTVEDNWPRYDLEPDLERLVNRAKVFTDKDE